MSGERVWICSDTHFGHESIFKHCKRPFATVKEMDEFIIENWNKVVEKHDHIYILGDFAFNNHLKYITALRGKKHLIIGNHDSMNKECLNRFVSACHYKQIKYGNRFFELTHCPMRTWNDCHRGNIHLFGHTHGRMKTYNLSFDIGIDTNGCKIYNMEDIMNMVKKREEEMIENKRISIIDSKKTYFQDDLKYFEYLLAKRGVKC